MISNKIPEGNTGVTYVRYCAVPVCIIFYVSPRQYLSANFICIIFVRASAMFYGGAYDQAVV